MGAIGSGAIGPIGPMGPCPIDAIGFVIIGVIGAAIGAATGSPMECTLGPVRFTTALNPVRESAVYSTSRTLPSGSTKEYAPRTTSPLRVSHCALLSPVDGSFTA